MEQSELLQRPWVGVPPTGRLLRTKEAAAYLGYCRSHYYALVRQGDLPKPIKIGRGSSGATGVPLSWLEAVLVARIGASAGGVA